MPRKSLYTLQHLQVAGKEFIQLCLDNLFPLCVSQAGKTTRLQTMCVEQLIIVETVLMTALHLDPSSYTRPCQVYEGSLDGWLHALGRCSLDLLIVCCAQELGVVLHLRHESAAHADHVDCCSNAGICTGITR